MTSPDLTSFDWILVNSSAGKDSQAMLDLVVEKARAAGVADERIVVVHCDLGRVEWKGTRELAETQARFYGLRFEVVSRAQGDLLDHVRARGKWPSSAARYCTSDHKRGQVARLVTALVRESGDLGRPVRVLNCLGLRAQESPARAKKVEFAADARLTNTKREAFTWHPILDWTEDQVWTRIRQSGVPYHPAYDLGMPRLSCCFCVLAGRRELAIAARANPELLDAYCEVEEEIGHTFRADLAIRELRDEVRAPALATAWEV